MRGNNSYSNDLEDIDRGVLAVDTVIDTILPRETVLYQSIPNQPKQWNKTNKDKQTEYYYFYYTVNVHIFRGLNSHKGYIRATFRKIMGKKRVSA